jgi:hypothetical protein
MFPSRGSDAVQLGLGRGELVVGERAGLVELREPLELGGVSPAGAAAAGAGCGGA